VAFTNSGEALECAARTNVELALVTLPSGRDTSLVVAAALKSADPDVKVMVIGDYVPEGKVETLSADDFLVKPVEISTVERRIRELLQNR
jgi:ActR/RegA family two-component response regulator